MMQLKEKLKQNKKREQNGISKTVAERYVGHSPVGTWLSQHVSSFLRRPCALNDKLLWPLSIRRPISKSLRLSQKNHLSETDTSLIGVLQSHTESEILHQLTRQSPAFLCPTENNESHRVFVWALPVESLIQDKITSPCYQEEKTWLRLSSA